MNVSTTQNPPSRIARRTHGQTHGPVTRLMSPSDFGQLLKPFVFLDLFDNGGKPFSGFGLHPHSGIATLTYVMEGSVGYEDTNGATGLVPAGGIEWMRAGGGVWHGGGGEPGRARGFQLWIALPPDQELGASESIYQAPDVIPSDGPARVLLGSYGTATSAIKAPSPINYLAVRLKAGERWRYQPPAEHTVLWAAVGMGSVLVPGDELREGELVAFNPSNVAIEFEAQTAAEFVVGSAVPHDYDLVLGSHSVHTTAKALRDAEARIATIQARLVQEGRLK